MDDLSHPRSSGPGRRARAVALAAALAFAGIPAGPAPAVAAEPPLEQAVKASFLFKFAPFVEWPPRAFPAPGSAFAICLLGDNPFGTLVDEIVRGQRIGGRRVLVRRLGGPGDAAGCQMLFAGHSGDAGYAPWSGVAGQPVLTISDRSNGVPGAMIQFVNQGGRIRFQIDDGAAKANGLAISSKLLGLAIAVDRK